MNAVIYYSNTGESEKIAKYLSKNLDFNLYDIYTLTDFYFEKMVMVFPIYCQNIPDYVKEFFKKVNTEKAVIIATYGKMSYGNVLYECKKNYNLNIVGAAYVPTKHSYLKNDISFSSFNMLNFVSECFEGNREVIIPRNFKNPLANFLSGTRSRLGVSLNRTKACTNCGICMTVCKNKKCIRCLKCACYCPNNAIKFKLNLFMRLYLSKKKKEKFIIYK